MSCSASKLKSKIQREKQYVIKCHVLTKVLVHIHSEVYQPGLQELSPRATVVKKKRGAFVELDSETRAFFIVRSCRSRMKHVGEWYLYEFFSRLLIGLFMGE